MFDYKHKLLHCAVMNCNPFISKCPCPKSIPLALH